jgi:hypothetical protein
LFHSNSFFKNISLGVSIDMVLTQIYFKKRNKRR